MKSLARYLKSSLTTKLKFPLPYQQTSYSQEGEDLIIKKLLLNHKPGIYLDVGAHHPYRYSNTQLLYELAWHGINLDPLPGTKKLFDRARPLDYTLEAGLSPKSQTKIYYQFTDGALNTFKKSRAQEVIKSGQSSLIKETALKLITPDQLFKICPYKPSQIDFLNLDTEGYELGILKSFDFNHFNPKIIAIENLNSFKSLKLTKFMASIKYSLIANTINTKIYLHSHY